MTDTTGATDTTMGAAAADTGGITLRMPNTPSEIKDAVVALLAKLEAIPGELTAELISAKNHVLEARIYIDDHFKAAIAAVKKAV